MAAVLDKSFGAIVKPASLMMDLKRQQKLERVARSRGISVNRLLQGLLIPVLDGLDEPEADDD